MLARDARFQYRRSEIARPRGDRRARELPGMPGSLGRDYADDRRCVLNGWQQLRIDAEPPRQDRLQASALALNR
jgi:hypothetical protein